MSETLSAAAAALGLPEALVQRSAEARAAETGSSVEEILAAWAGGAPPPAPSEQPPAQEETDAAEPAEADEPGRAAPAPEIVIEVPQTTTEPAPVAAGPYRPPVLVGEGDNPLTALVGAVGLFLVIALVGVLGAGLPFDEPGARSSAISYSSDAQHGRDLYAGLGCASCHTQAVRPIVADVGLGAVTLNDTNQVVGTRRFGPDLSDIGTRMTADQISAVIGGLGDHPALSLAPQDLAALTAYLAETKAPAAAREAGS